MIRKCIAGSLLSACAILCSAQDNAARPPEYNILVTSKINKGDLPYRSFYNLLVRLRALLPPAPRIIEPVYQMSFSHVPIEEEDNFLKPSWNVAIVGTDTDIELPMIRGGYFDLPEPGDKVAKDAKDAKDASIMFNSQTQKNFLRVAYTTRLRPNHALGFTDMKRALFEVSEVQKKIPWYTLGFRAEKYAKFDAIKACFAADDGELRLDGEVLDTIHSARCRIYKIDPQLIDTNREVNFSPAPEIVVLEDSARYLRKHASG